MELTEKKEFDLLSLGEIMLRLSPPDNERITRGDSFSKQAGGAELNAITGAAMLGLRCGIISKLPANDLGVYIKNRVRLCGVSDDYLVYDDDTVAASLCEFDIDIFKQGFLADPVGNVVG